MTLIRSSLFVVVFCYGCPPNEPVTAPSDKMEKVDAGRPVATSETAALDAGAPTTAKTLFVRDALVDCEGERPMKCMQVRESETGEWTLLYGSIEGFTYEPGFLYELHVETKPVPPASDQPSRRLRLVSIVAKTKAH